MTAPAHVIKATSIDDLGVIVVDLPYGTYLIDGEVVSNQGFGSYNNPRQVSVKNVDDIRIITKSKIITHYVDSKENMINPEQYEEDRQTLLKNAVWDEDSEEYNWNTLEDEFAYRKYMQQWKPVHKELTEYSEPLLTDKTHIRKDTGNPYIVSGFMTGQANTPLYSYSRTSAMTDMLKKKFESLGMEFKEGVSYSATEGKKVWSNSNHSHLEYVTAFGKYVFNKQVLSKMKGEFKGDLEYLTKIYEEDKKWLDEYIQTLYNLHFRNEKASGVLLSEVSAAVKQCITYVNTIEVKAKSETSKRSALNVLNKALELVNKEVLEK